MFLFVFEKNRYNPVRIKHYPGVTLIVTASSNNTTICASDNTGDSQPPDYASTLSDFSASTAAAVTRHTPRAPQLWESTLLCTKRKSWSDEVLRNIHLPPTPLSSRVHGSPHTQRLTTGTSIALRCIACHLKAANTERLDRTVWTTYTVYLVNFNRYPATFYCAP